MVFAYKDATVAAAAAAAAARARCQSDTNPRQMHIAQRARPPEPPSRVPLLCQWHQVIPVYFAVA